MNRQTAIQLNEYKGFGGSYHDSISHAALFRNYQPWHFGVKTAQLFSSSLKSDLINKKFTYMTIANGNFHVLPGGVDDYTWTVVGDADTDARVTEVIATGQPGKDNKQFQIALDRDWYHEPVLLLSEDPNAPMLRIIGHPEPLSSNSFLYTVELQSGDPNDWMPLDLLQRDRLFCRVSTMVGDELNPDYGPDQYGQMVTLRSWVGQYANKIEFTDKFIRAEIASAQGKRPPVKGLGYNFGGMNYSDAVGSGYIYQQDFKTRKGEIIEQGVFITKADARLLERTEMDREMMCEFGKLQKTTHAETGRVIKAAPGWRQLVRDGHYWEHNGSFTLSDLSEYLNTIFFRRKDFADRKIKIASGEGGIEFLSRLIAAEASTFQTLDTLFVRKRENPLGYHSNELEFGAQFTKIKLFNGIEVEIIYDPLKDDDKLFKQKAPGTNRPIESFAMDIFDFGYTDYKAEGARDENITMIMQDGVEEYYHVCNVYDFRTGAITDGSNAWGHSKECGIYRTLCGSLGIWDVSRVGRIEYNPDL